MVKIVGISVNTHQIPPATQLRVIIIVIQGCEDSFVTNHVMQWHMDRIAYKNVIAPLLKQ